MTVSALDSPILSALLGDEEVAAFLSVDADLAAMLAFEAALAEAQAALGLREILARCRSPRQGRGAGRGRRADADQAAARKSRRAT